MNVCRYENECRLTRKWAFLAGRIYATMHLYFVCQRDDWRPPKLRFWLDCFCAEGRVWLAESHYKTCINRFYGCIDLRVIFQSAHRIGSFFPCKYKINRSQMSKVVYKATCWDCQNFYIAKTKRRLRSSSDTHCKIKETLLIQKLKPTLNDNVSCEKLYLY